jgi:hypothetical protein
VNEDSLLERVTAAAEKRNLSQNTLTAYRCTWLKAIAWAAAEVSPTRPCHRIGEFYEEATSGRSASHHLQVKAALQSFTRFSAPQIRLPCATPAHRYKPSARPASFPVRGHADAI